MAARGGRPELPALQRVALAAAARSLDVPRHVAFIMDGNRRWAKQRGQRATQGHFSGYATLLCVLEWCMKLGVEEVTVYAFSIENFKRPEEEVATLMALARDKFTEFLEHTELVMQHGIRVNVLGDLELLPEDVRAAAENVMNRTRDHKNLVLNICFAYTSSEEIARTVREVVRDARAGIIDKEDISSDLISERMYTRGSDPQLLIRTSGETRLSDFLVWQAAHAHLYFINVPWPELTVWQLLWAFWDYHVFHGKPRYPAVAPS